MTPIALCRSSETGPVIKVSKTYHFLFCCHFLTHFGMQTHFMPVMHSCMLKLLKLHLKELDYKKALIYTSLYHPLLTVMCYYIKIVHFTEALVFQLKKRPPDYVPRKGRKPDTRMGQQGSIPPEKLPYLVELSPGDIHTNLHNDITSTYKENQGRNRGFYIIEWQQSCSQISHADLSLRQSFSCTDVTEMKSGPPIAH